MKPQVIAVTKNAKLMTECELMWDDINFNTIDEENPQHLELLVKRVRDHIAEHEMCPCSVWALEWLPKAEKQQGFVKKWSWHWWLSRTLRGESDHHFENPVQRQLNISMDYQDHFLMAF